MTFSIIIPIYNLQDSDVFAYFDRLLGSISNNFKDADIKESCLEIIMINDSPNQNICDLLEMVAQKYNLGSKIKLFNNITNEGQAYSRNRGAEIAQGEYLHFIDQDDFISSEFYKKMFVMDNADIYIANPYLYVTSNNQSKSFLKKKTIFYYERATYLSDVRFFCFSNIAVSPGQYLISKHLFEKVGGYTNLKNRGSDDWGIFVKLLCLESKIFICFSCNSIFYYRLHSSQGMKILNIRASVREQVEKIIHTKNIPIYMRMLMYFKVSSLTVYLLKMLYFIFYNRTDKKQ